MMFIQNVIRSEGEKSNRKFCGDGSEKLAKWLHVLLVHFRNGNYPVLPELVTGGSGHYFSISQDGANRCAGDSPHGVVVKGFDIEG